MTIEGTIPVQLVSTTLAEADVATAIAYFLTQHPRARVEKIDGQIVRGICECGQPVMEKDRDYTYDNDTERYTCSNCKKEFK